MRSISRFILSFTIAISAISCQKEEEAVPSQEFQLVKETLQIYLTGSDTKIGIELRFEYDDEGLLIQIDRKGYDDGKLVSTTRTDYTYNEDNLVVASSSESTDFGTFEKTLEWNENAQLVQVNMPDGWFEKIEYYSEDSLHVSTMHGEVLAHSKGIKLDDYKNPVVQSIYDGQQTPLERETFAYDYSKKHPYALFKRFSNSGLTGYSIITNPPSEYTQHDLDDGGSITSNYIHRYNAQDLLETSTINYFLNGSELFKVETIEYEYEAINEN